MANLFASAAYKYENIVEGGSNHAYIKGVADYAGAALDPADGFVHIPVRGEWKFTPSTSKTEKTTDGGDKITTKTESSYEVTYKTPQKDAASIKEFWKAASGKTLLMVLEGDKSASLYGDKRPYYAYFLKMDGPAAHGTGVDPEYKFTAYAATGACTINLASDGPDSGAFAAFGATTGTIVFAEGDPFAMSEC